MRRPAHIPNLAADRARALDLVPVSRETVKRLDSFVVLLLERQQTTNLISDGTIPEIWTRHIADSLQLLTLAPEAKIWIDLGSGGGFPGIVLACALADISGAKVHLVESKEKKCLFLQEVADKLELPVTVHCKRIEEFTTAFKGKFDIVTARAVAPLAKLFPLVQPLLKKGGKGLFLKGQDVAVELTEASKYWSIKPTLVQSRTDDRGRIVVVEGQESRKKGG